MDTPVTHLVPTDPRYPALLASVASAPELDVCGTLEPDDALAIAIVGARQATAYGIELAETLAADLAARGVTIVSGLARGIDTAAHRGALAAGGRTLAVLGHGIAHVYPPENRALAEAIVGHGALLSQFPASIGPLPYHFPVRNRTLAGLALGVVVVEAAERRESWRRAIEGAPTSESGAARPAPGSDEARMLELLSADEPQHIERLIARAGVDAARAGTALIGLELAGWARQLAGQRWVATGARVRRA